MANRWRQTAGGPRIRVGGSRVRCAECPCEEGDCRSSCANMLAYYDSFSAVDIAMTAVDSGIVTGPCSCNLLDGTYTLAKSATLISSVEFSYTFPTPVRFCTVAGRWHDATELLLQVSCSGSPGSEVVGFRLTLYIDRDFFGPTSQFLVDMVGHPLATAAHVCVTSGSLDGTSGSYCEATSVGFDFN